jgi:hypothetical protein
MKTALALMFVCATLAPVASYAQNSAPLTRAQVEQQIVQAQHDGTLHQSKVYYPEEMVRSTAPDQSYGASTESTAQTGSSARTPVPWLTPSPYAHH